MGQALHYCVEKASVAVILHWEGAVVLICLSSKSVSLLGVHYFKAARVTAFGHYW
jgi:hypothetical protein